MQDNLHLHTLDIFRQLFSQKFVEKFEKRQVALFECQVYRVMSNLTEHQA